MRIDILTLFPEVFGPYLESSIIGRAVTNRLVSVRCVDFREFARDRHRSVDDRPFGGGPGMVLMCEPVFDAFRRGNNALAAGIPGTGLGLSIVREIVEQAGGRIRVASRSNEGSSFTVSFPTRGRAAGRPRVRDTRVSEVVLEPGAEKADQRAKPRGE